MIQDELGVLGQLGQPLDLNPELIDQPSDTEADFFIHIGGVCELGGESHEPES